MMKKLKLLLPILIIASASVSLQAKPSENVREHREELAALNLTPEQQTQMRDIRAKYRPQLEALRPTENSQPSKERREQVNAIRQQMRAEIARVLTPTQLAQWEQLRQGHENNRPHKQRPN